MPELVKDHLNLYIFDASTINNSYSTAPGSLTLAPEKTAFCNGLRCQHSSSMSFPPRRRLTWTS